MRGARLTALNGGFRPPRAVEAAGHTGVLNAGGPRTPELWDVYSAGS